MGHRPVDRGHLSQTQSDTETLEVERQNKLSLHSVKTVLFFDLVLTLMSASSTLTLIPINVPFILNICNVNQLVLIWRLTDISTRYRGQGLKCVVPPAIAIIAGAPQAYTTHIRLTNYNYNTLDPSGMWR